MVLYDGMIPIWILRSSWYSHTTGKWSINSCMYEFVYGIDGVAAVYLRPIAQCEIVRSKYKFLLAVWGRTEPYWAWDCTSGTLNASITARVVTNIGSVQQIVAAPVEQRIEPCSNNRVAGRQCAHTQLTDVSFYNIHVLASLKDSWSSSDDSNNDDAVVLYFAGCGSTSTVLPSTLRCRTSRLRSCHFVVDGSISLSRWVYGRSMFRLLAAMLWRRIVIIIYRRALFTNFPTASWRIVLHRIDLAYSGRRSGKEQQLHMVRLMNHVLNIVIPTLQMMRSCRLPCCVCFFLRFLWFSL